MRDQHFNADLNFISRELDPVNRSREETRRVVTNITITRTFGYAYAQEKYIAASLLLAGSRSVSVHSRLSPCVPVYETVMHSSRPRPVSRAAVRRC